MKWYELALKLLPGFELVLATAVPAAVPVIPFVNRAIQAAQDLHGDANNAAKKQLVYETTGAAVATGKVQLPPEVVKAITDAVFTAIDGIHAVVKANQNTSPATSSDATGHAD